MTFILISSRDWGPRIFFGSPNLPILGYFLFFPETQFTILRTKFTQPSISLRSHNVIILLYYNVCAYCISLTFFFHGAIAVRLQQVTSRDCYYRGRTSYLARFAVQVPIAVVWNAFMVVHVHYLYDISHAHLYYVFLGLLLVSVCGIQLGNYNLLHITTLKSDTYS